MQVAGCLPAADRIKILYDAVMLECRTAASFKQVVTDNKDYFQAVSERFPCAVQYPQP